MDHKLELPYCKFGQQVAPNAFIWKHSRGESHLPKLCEFVPTYANLVNSFQVKSHLQLLLLTFPLKRGYTPCFYSETRNFKFL